MNAPLIGFLTVVLLVLVGVGYFLRGALWSISTLAAEHAACFATSYVKGASLMFIAASTAFAAGYSALDAGMKAAMLWAPYVIFFSLPISAALSVLVAFLDRSAERAEKHAEADKAAKAATNPPFVTPL